MRHIALFFGLVLALGTPALAGKKKKKNKNGGDESASATDSIAGADIPDDATSKSFAKELMVRHGVPTGRAETCESLDDASDYIQMAEMPVVVKADGLAAGKGVAIASTRDEALELVRSQRLPAVPGDAHYAP